MSKTIYVAAPYTHSDYSVIEERMLAVNKYCAMLLAHTGCAIISPLTMGHSWQEVDEDLPHVGEFWLTWSQKLLGLCNEMHVLKLEGWDSSKGVLSELQYANAHGIKVLLIDLPSPVEMGLSVNRYCPLSSVPGEVTSYEQLIDYLLDNRYSGVVNDIPPPPHVEYDISDLRDFFHSLIKYVKCRI